MKIPSKNIFITNNNSIKLKSTNETSVISNRNSIKESISAVGVCCRKITGDSELDKAIMNLEKKGIVIPSMLKESMRKLYFFTNGKDGIRHELLNDGNRIDKEEAYYMLVTCSAFVNYLIEKWSKVSKQES